MRQRPADQRVAQQSRAECQLPKQQPLARRIVDQECALCNDDAEQDIVFLAADWLPEGDTVAEKISESKDAVDVRVRK